MSDVAISVPPGLGAEEVRRVADRAVQALALVGDVRQVLADSPAQVGPGHLAQAALREERWRDLETRWSLLSATELATMSGHRPQQARTLTSNLRRRKGLAGIKRGGALVYPSYQLVERDGVLVVASAWQQLRELLAEADWSDADVLAWSAAPNAWLDGRSPAEEVQAHPDGASDELRAAVRAALPSTTDG